MKREKLQISKGRLIINVIAAIIFIPVMILGLMGYLDILLYGLIVMTPLAFVDRWMYRIEKIKRRELNKQ